jgi:hypothetical protein
MTRLGARGLPPKSMLYATLTGRYEVARAGTTAIAAKAAPVQVAAAVPDPAGTTEAFAAYQPVRPLQQESGPVFQALFHTTERQEPVSPRVNQLWTKPATAPPPRVNVALNAQAPANGRPLDLFQDMAPDVRGLFTGRG